MTILAITDKVYAIKFFCNLFKQFPKAHNHPMFSNTIEIFNQNYVTKKPQKRIRLFGLKKKTSQVIYFKEELQYQQD